MKHPSGSLDVWYMKKLEISRSTLFGVKSYNFHLPYINLLSEIPVYEGTNGSVDWVLIFLYVHVHFRLVQRVPRVLLPPYRNLFSGVWVLGGPARLLRRLSQSPTWSVLTKLMPSILITRKFTSTSSLRIKICLICFIIFFNFNFFFI